MTSGHRPNNAKTCPSRSGPGWRPPSTRHPRAVPGFSATDGAAMSSACSRCLRTACWHAGQVSGPPNSVSRGKSGRSEGASPMSTAQRERRMVARSCRSRISSCRKNSAQVPSGVSEKQWVISPDAFHRPAGCDDYSCKKGKRGSAWRKAITSPATTPMPWRDRGSFGGRCLPATTHRRAPARACRRRAVRGAGRTSAGHRCHCTRRQGPRR